MVNSLSQPHTAAALDDEPDVVRPACPMCHTPASLSQSALDAGGAWRCVRCGQHWDAGRLAAVAAYTAWVVERERADARSTDRSQKVAQSRHPSTEPVDGTP
jgi:hypothetical protein